MNISVFLKSSQVPCWSFGEANEKLLHKLMPDAVINVCHDEESFLRCLPEAEVACVWYFKTEWLAKAGKLKVLSTPAAGKDYFHVNLPEGVQLWNGAFHGELIGQTVAAYVLAECRGVTLCERLRGKNPWPRREAALHMRSLKGQHAVILGFGSIGRETGRFLKPFGMRITGVKRTISDKPDYFSQADKIDTIENLDSILPETDHLILALPSDTGTDNILSRERLKKLPSHAVVYNIGRGNAIDEEALCDVLREGLLSAAYLDVFKKEPLEKDSPLFSCPNLFLMPHASAISPDYLDLYVEELAGRLKKI